MTHATWAREVKKIYGDMCAYCGTTKRIEAHHIKPRRQYPQLSEDLKNGVALCHDCHRAAHYGSYNGDTKAYIYTPLKVDPLKIVAWLERDNGENAD